MVLSMGQIHANFDDMTGKFGMRELYDLLISPQWIKREIKRTKLESDFNTSTGLPKRRRDATEDLENAEDLE